MRPDDDPNRARRLVDLCLRKFTTNQLGEQNGGKKKEKVLLLTLFDFGGGFFVRVGSLTKSPHLENSATPTSNSPPYSSSSSSPFFFSQI